MRISHAGIGRIVQHNRDRYFSELPFGVKGWDAVVLTAGSAAQADYYRLQIEQRRHRGLLQQATEFLVVPDPPGTRVGSGGSTLLALGQLLRHFTSGTQGAGIHEVFRRRKFLILHSGGESRRLPLYSGIGKLFARVPLGAGEGVSSLFDEFLVSLCGAPRQFMEGVVVASGDVLLLFDNMQLQFHPKGVVGVSMPADPETASRHGVYIAQPDGRVKRFLHKLRTDQLIESGGVQNGMAQIDTGIVWFDVPTLATMLDIAGLSPDSQPEESAPGPAHKPQPLSLYADLLSVLAMETKLDEYLTSPGDDGAPPPASLRALRRTLWQRLRGTDFHVSRLPAARFIHFGTCAEYRHALMEGVQPDSDLHWKNRVAAVGGEDSESGRESHCVWLNTICTGPADTDGSLIEDSFIGNGIKVRDSLVSRVQTEKVAITLPPACVLFQTPVCRTGRLLTATFVLGINDNPKTLFAAGGTFLNRPWRPDRAPRAWNAGLSPEHQNLWHAAIFPIEADRDTGLRRALALATALNGEHADGRPTTIDPVDGETISLNEALEAFDTRRAADEALALEDRIAAARFNQAVLGGTTADKCAHVLGQHEADIIRRLALAVENTGSHPLQNMRVLYCAGDVLAQRENAMTEPGLTQKAVAYRDQAFERQATLIRTSRPLAVNDRISRIVRRTVAVHAAARLDFGGGWSDTPPFSLYCNGTVLNAAITLNGALPIKVCVERLGDARIELRSLDLDVSMSTDSSAPIMNYRDPADPFALHKAALVLCGAVPENEASVGDLFADGHGLRVTTDIAVPKGSGLGTSSILAGAVLTALYRAGGRTRTERELFDDIFDLEQMLTTGGGWQDQVGGLTPGIKLTHSSPGVPPDITMDLLNLSAATAEAMERRLVLIYTGHRRLAKGILRAIMGRYLANDPVVVRTLREIQQIAQAMHSALETGALDSLGQLMTRHWELNKQMDTGSTTPAIDELFAALEPCLVGAKLAGAGGGGFIEAVIKDPAGDTTAIREILQSDFPEAAIWDCRITGQPLYVDQQ